MKLFFLMAMTAYFKLFQGLCVRKTMCSFIVYKSKNSSAVFWLAKTFTFVDYITHNSYLDYFRRHMSVFIHKRQYAIWYDDNLLTALELCA